MPAYLIQGGDKIKIGWAVDVEARRRQLQTSHYEDLVVVRVIDGDRSTERWMQDRFKEQRMRGEWHSFHPDMFVVVPPPAASPPPKQKREKVPLVSWAATWPDEAEKRRLESERLRREREKDEYRQRAGQ